MPMLKQCPDLNTDYTDSNIETENENELTIENKDGKKYESKRESDTEGIIERTIKKLKYENCSFTFCNNKLKVQMNIVLFIEDEKEKEEEISVNNHVITAAISNYKVNDEFDTTSEDSIEIIITEDESEEE
ncbi:hypothetical protein ABK040_001520 [Willaertia magna]